MKTLYRFRGGRLSLTLLVAGQLLLFLAAVSPVPAQVPCEVTPSPEWKNDVDYPFDSFHALQGETSWVKFTILTCDPETVYFQHSRTFPFHYDFGSTRLDPLVGLSREAFDRVTLFADDQQAILGAVLLPSRGEPVELAVQLVRRDAFTPTEAADLIQRVRAHVGAPRQARLLYFPTHEQRDAAEAGRALFESRGIELGSVTRWGGDSIVYSEGWALGRLKFFAADEIAAAFRDGRLTTSDILLTDGVPASIPSLAGVITLAPATPNSHVAILARNFGIPFVHPIFEADVERARALVDRRVVLRVFEAPFLPNFRLIDVEDELDETTVEEILDLKVLPPLDIAVKETHGAVGIAVRDLGRDDVRFVGGKATNYRHLLEAIPANAREAAALTFDLWDGFLSQPIGPGQSLRDEINRRLEPFAAFPPTDPAGLADALGQVRELIRDDERTFFATRLRNGVLATLADARFGFDPERRLRFRSSTNVEDSDQFTGAGLYDSFSGCLADDLDGDASGPSRCDPEKSKERGVFRAIRRVFASFYNENAYLERRRWGVDEDDVGMAILVHHSFPDETELANGVVTLERRFGRWFATVVSQPDAFSVTNPEDGSTPEEVIVGFHRSTTTVELVASASRLLLGETVLDSDAEYIDLGELVVAVAERFLEDAGPGDGIFDFEYKKVAGEGLVVKQVRRIPSPDDTRQVTPFLVNEPGEAIVFQGETGVVSANVFTTQRLGPRWRLETRSMWLTPANLVDGIYADVSMVMNDGCGDERRFSGRLEDLPDSTHTWDEGSAISRHAWMDSSGPVPGRYRLEARRIPTSVDASASPVITWRDLDPPRLGVEYDLPVVLHDQAFTRTTATEESVMLLPRPTPNGRDVVQVRRVSQDGVTVETAYVWPAGTDGFDRTPADVEVPPVPGDPPNGFLEFNGYKTAPLVGWVETRITGLTTAPIVLRSAASQAYQPGHHNFSEAFLFEPRREPNIAPGIVDELEAAGVDFIEVIDGLSGSSIALHSAAQLGHDCDDCVRIPRGDYNDDGRRDLSDGVYLLNFLFSGGPEPIPPVERRDLNGDRQTNLSDAQYLFTHLFLGGPPPVGDCVE